jgi:hypothetical protein
MGSRRTGEEQIGEDRRGDELAAIVEEEGVMSLCLGSGTLNSVIAIGEDMDEGK